MNEPLKHPMVPELYEVRRVRRETYDTFTLKLFPQSGGDVPGFLPGQFCMLYVYGVGEAPISISGDPVRRDNLLFTVRAVGTVTNELRSMKIGDVIGARGPFGSHWNLDRARGKDILIIAGGIGLAPLRPAIYRILEERDAYGKINILYGARTPKDMLYVHELERWRGRFDLNVEATVDHARRDWKGHVGVVPKLIGDAEFDPENVEALICGPEIMMRFTVMELNGRGVGDDAIQVTMERNMKCAVGFCGHCQFGPKFICKDGPVFPFSSVKSFFGKREV